MGMEGNLEYIMKPSHESAGCSSGAAPSPAVMSWPMGHGGTEGQEGCGEQQWGPPGSLGGRWAEKARRRCWEGETYMTWYPPSLFFVLPENGVPGKQSQQMKRRRLAAGLTDVLQHSSPYFSSNSYKMYQLRRTYMGTHSFSGGLPSAREGHKSSDCHGLLAWQKMSSPRASCKALEHLFKTAPRARRRRRRSAGGRRVGPMGQGGTETLLSQGAETDGKAAGDRRGIPFGSLFVHECFLSCPSWLRTFYSLTQS